MKRALLSLALIAGCAPAAELTWTGPDALGPIRSAEWVRYTTTSDTSFAGELTMNFFVLSTVPDLCGRYQEAIEETHTLHTEFIEARAPFEAAGDLSSSALCALTRDYLAALGDATSRAARAGDAFITTSFAVDPGGLGRVEGEPEDGTWPMTSDPTVEHGDFVRTGLRFVLENPYTAAAASLSCADPDWDAGSAADATIDYATEAVAGDGPDVGVLLSEITSSETVHLAHRQATAVRADRGAAGLLETNAEYRLCSIRTHEFYLRLYER